MLLSKWRVMPWRWSSDDNSNETYAKREREPVLWLQRGIYPHYAVMAALLFRDAFSREFIILLIIHDTDKKRIMPLLSCLCFSVLDLKRVSSHLWLSLSLPLTIVTLISENCSNVEICQCVLRTQQRKMKEKSVWVWAIDRLSTRMQPTSFWCVHVH